MCYCHICNVQRRVRARTDTQPVLSVTSCIKRRRTDVKKSNVMQRREVLIKEQHVNFTCLGFYGATMFLFCSSINIEAHLMQSVNIFQKLDS